MCDGCGQRMSGCTGKEPVFKCSTYMNQGPSACDHNWIEVQTALGFAVEGVRQILSGTNQRERLAAALREVLSEKPVVGPTPPHELADLEAKHARLVEMRRTIFLKTVDPDESIREDAKATYRRIDDEARAVQAQIQAVRADGERPARDLNAEVASCEQVLEELSANLHLVHPDELHQTLEALGVVVVVEFEHRKVGRRNIVPRAASVHVGGIPEAGSPGELTSYSKDGRGERIRTSDLCNPIAAR